MIDVEEKVTKSLLDEYDYIEKIRVFSLTDRIQWFIENKPSMSQSTKWDAFYDIVDDYEIDMTRLLKRINKVIVEKSLQYIELQ